MSFLTIETASWHDASSPIGKAMQNGVRLALDALNSRTPRDETTIDLVFEDDGNTKEGALNGLENLIGDPRVVAIIGEIFSPFVLASRPIVEQVGVSFLTGGTHPKTTENSRWIFRVGASDTLLTTLMAQYAVERLGVKKIVVITIGPAFMRREPTSLSRPSSSSMASSPR